MSSPLLPRAILPPDDEVSNFRPQTTLLPINRVTTPEGQRRSLGPGRVYKTLPMTFFRRHLFQPASSVTPDRAPRPVLGMWHRGGECPASGTRLRPADRFLSTRGALHLSGHLPARLPPNPSPPELRLLPSPPASRGGPGSSGRVPPPPEWSPARLGQLAPARGAGSERSA